MQSFEQQREKFSSFLENYNFPDAPQSLYDGCRHILSIGGKRVRPVMCLMAHDIFSNTTNIDVLNAALAIELFHNFSLVHDDIMDNADIRRGEPTVHKKFSMPTAILAGDVLNVFAYELLNELNAKNSKEIFSLFNKTAIEVCEGQQLDMDFEQQEQVSIDEYLRMIQLKTSVLLASSLSIGAMIGNASEADKNYLYEFGKNVGIAFQLKDDYLDAFGDGDKTGKIVGGDILANKKTIFYCYCMQKADEESMQKIQELQQQSGQDKLANTLSLYEKLGARDYVYQLKDDYSKKAFAALENLSVPQEKLSELKNLARYLLQREH